MSNAVELITENIESVLAGVPAAVLILDSEGRCRYANQAACELLERSLDEVRSATIRDFAPDPIEAEVLWREFLSARHAEGESTLKRPDGSTVPVAFSSACDLVPGLHISVLHDLSAQRRVERAIRRDEEIFNRAFRASPVPTNIQRLDNGGIVDLNQAFTEATGYTHGDLIGRTGTSVGLLKDSSRFEEMLDALREGETLARARTRVVTRDGSEKEFHIALQRFDADHEALVMGVYTDLSTI
ncbi:MAG: PAS domain-containing protein [Dehalococcoidia bacterium]